MSGTSASSGLLGSLGPRLQAWSNELWRSTESHTHEAAHALARPEGSVRVLVVDDNPVNLIVISAMLEMRGLQSLQAADGAEAVALACELHFDLVLMDLQMPILDGLGATAAIRRFESQTSRRAVPVVAFSSSPPGAGVLASHGLDGSLAKPCEQHELEACLTRWCPTYRPASTRIRT